MVELMADSQWRPAWEAGVVAFLVALVAVGLVRRAARWLGALDEPDEIRRVHVLPTPRLGGVGVLAGILVGTIVFVEWGSRTGLARLNVEQLAVLLACATAACLLGAVDDVRSLSWRTKLAGQAAIALAAVLAPLAVMDPPSAPRLLLVVNFIDLPFVEPVAMPVVLSVLLVVAWIVAVMNMLNFTDGIDGLAAGQSTIMAATFAVIAASYGRLTVAILAAATAGAAAGFLPHNFRRGGARIFLGDSGSMLLGFLLATIAVQGVLKTTAAVALVIPFALLAVPIADTAFVVLKRRRYGLPVVAADRWHLHHRLLNVGLSPKRATVLLCMWTAAMAGLALALRFVEYGNSNDWHAPGLVRVAFVALGALAVSLLIAVRLEIIKTRAVRTRNQARRDARTSAQPGASGDPGPQQPRGQVGS